QENALIPLLYSLPMSSPSSPGVDNTAGNVDAARARLEAMPLHMALLARGSHHTPRTLSYIHLHKQTPYNISRRLATEGCYTKLSQSRWRKSGDSFPVAIANGIQTTDCILDNMGGLRTLNLLLHAHMVLFRLSPCDNSHRS